MGDSSISLMQNEMSSGMSMKEVGRYFRVGTSTVSAIIADVCTAIWDVLGPRELLTSDNNRWLEISEKFGDRWNFPRCLGKLNDDDWCSRMHRQLSMVILPAQTGITCFSYAPRLTDPGRVIVDSSVFIFVGKGRGQSELTPSH